MQSASNKRAGGVLRRLLVAVVMPASIWAFGCESISGLGDYSLDKTPPNGPGGAGAAGAAGAAGGQAGGAAGGAQGGNGQGGTAQVPELCLPRDGDNKCTQCLKDNGCCQGVVYCTKDTTCNGCLRAPMPPPMCFNDPLFQEIGACYTQTCKMPCIDEGQEPQFLAKSSHSGPRTTRPAPS